MLFDHLKRRDFITLLGGRQRWPLDGRAAAGDAGHGGPSVVVASPDRCGLPEEDRNSRRVA